MPRSNAPHRHIRRSHETGFARPFNWLGALGFGVAGAITLAQPAASEISFARMDRLVTVPATQSPGAVFSSAPPQTVEPGANATMGAKAAAAAAAVTAAVNGPRPVLTEDPLGPQADILPAALPGDAPEDEAAAAVATGENCRDTASGARFCAVPMDKLEGRAAGWHRVPAPSPAYAVGEAFPIYDHNMLIDPTRYGLPPVTGPWRYYKTDAATYRVSASDGIVLEVMPR